MQGRWWTENGLNKVELMYRWMEWYQKHNRLNNGKKNAALVEKNGKRDEELMRNGQKGWIEWS